MTESEVVPRFLTPSVYGRGRFILEGGMLVDSVTIKYLGHACFTLEAGGYRTVIDPYCHGMVPGLPDLHVEAEAVYCSHGHDDHSFVQAVALGEAAAPTPYKVEIITVPHDNADGTKRGMNKIHLFDFDGLRVAHMGDIGRALTAAEQEKLFGLDALLLPVGGFYTIDAAQACEMVQQLKPRVTIPMHYRTDCTGFAQIAHLQDFTERFDSVVYGENSLTITKETKEQIHVLKYKG